MFNDALDLILKFEGGYSNDPDDPGGATNYGITQDTYDPTRVKKVKNITKEEVSKIYERDYWKAASCDKIEKLSPAIAKIHFDCAVNCGVIRANKLLQQVLGVKDDGIIGPLTLSKVDDSLLKKKSYLDRRKVYYDTIIQRNPKLAKFRKSWFHRLNKLAELCDLRIKYEA